MDENYYGWTDAGFTCPECLEHVVTTVELPLALFSPLKRVSHGHGYYDLACHHCDRCYTASVEVVDDEVYISVANYPDTVVETWSNDESHPERFREAPPANPWQRFMDATDQIRSVMQGMGSDSDGSHMVNRMVFTQYVAAFEAYLAETLIRNVEADPTAIRKLVAADSSLKAVKLDLARILDEPDIVLAHVRSHLRGIVYHRLPQVNGLYHSTLGIKVLKEKVESDLLMKAVELRHDCVHRNGFDKDGTKLTAFMPEYIEQVAATLIELVGRVEASVQFKGVVDVPLPDSQSRDHGSTP